MSVRQIAAQKLMDKAAVTQAGTSYSDVMVFERCTGIATVKLIATSAGSATITISQQCSLNYDSNYPARATWYDPIDASAVALGVVGTAVAMTAGKYISYNPILTPYIRFKVVEGNTAAAVVSLTLFFQEEI